MKFLITFFLCCLAITGFCQRQELPNFDYKYNNTHAVLQNIGLAFGSNRPIPELVITNSNQTIDKIAWFEPDPKPVIFIEQRLYDICTTLGKDSLNGLACVIGHELAHYYREHKWSDGFIDLAIHESETKHDAEKNKITIEAEADYFGLFYGYLAGYQTLDVMPAILTKIYDEYDLPSKVEGYLPLHDRIKIATEKTEALKPLAYAFEAGEFLYLKKYYAEAATCFRYVLQLFPSSEIYNNLGITLLAEAGELMDDDGMCFAYPFEVDTRNRLMNKTTRSQSIESQTTRQKLLEAAIDHFEKAKTLNRNYNPAYINLAIAQSWLGNQEIAVGIINELERISSKNGGSLSGNAHLVRGIAMLKNERGKEAEKDFDQMREKKAFMSDYNYELYLQFDTSWTTALMDEINQWIQQYLFPGSKENSDQPTTVAMDATELANAEALSFSQLVTLNDNNHPVRIDYFMPDEDNCSLVLKVKIKECTFYLLNKIHSDYPNEKESKCSDFTVENLQNRFGQPKYIVAGAANSQFYFYDKAHIIFEINDDKVTGWTTYKASIF